MPDDIREAFWRPVFETEAAPLTTNLQQLLGRGAEVPMPQTLDDEARTVKLREVIHALADLRVFPNQGDPRVPTSRERLQRVGRRLRRRP